jgi:hypothetical protein
VPWTNICRQIARFSHAAHILYLRIKANIVEGAIRQIGFLRQRRYGYRFFASRCHFAQSTGFPAPRALSPSGNAAGWGRTDVNRVDLAIRQQFTIVACRVFDRVRSSEFAHILGGSSRHARDLHIAKTP